MTLADRLVALLLDVDDVSAVSATTGTFASIDVRASVAVDGGAVAVSTLCVFGNAPSWPRQTRRIRSPSCCVIGDEHELATHCSPTSLRVNPDVLLVRHRQPRSSLDPQTDDGQPGPTKPATQALAQVGSTSSSRLGRLDADA